MQDRYQKKDPREEPKWNPISILNNVSHAVDSQVDALFDMYEHLNELRDTPFILDDALIDRATQLYSEILNDAWVYEEQFRHWSRGKLTKWQKMEIERLRGQTIMYRKVSHEVLKLASELKKGTIDRVFRLSDDGKAMLVVMKKTALLK